MTMSQRMCIMNGGQVVQIGKPLEVYRDPADIFVARFLGSPPMNLIDAALVVDGENAGARFGEHAVALAGWRARDIAAHAGKPVVLGVQPQMLRPHAEDDGFPGMRPEHLRLRRNAPSDNCIAGNVVTVEPLGAETLLTIDAGGTSIIARLGADTQAQVGERLAFFFEPGTAYLFDPATSVAIAKSRKG